MSKTFFDMNSKNTFNQLECYVFGIPKYDPKDKELYWVTKTFHSIGQTLYPNEQGFYRYICYYCKSIWGSNKIYTECPNCCARTIGYK